MLEIPGIVGEGIDIYPPNTAGRPKLTFNDLNTALNIIKESKLFFALLRCLDDKPENRYYLFI